MNAKFTKLKDEDEKAPKSDRLAGNRGASSQEVDLEGLTEIQFHHAGTAVLGESSSPSSTGSTGHSSGGSELKRFDSAGSLSDLVKSRRSFIKGAMLVFTACVVPLIIVIIILSSMLSDLLHEDSTSSSSTPQDSSDDAAWQVFSATSSDSFGTVSTDTSTCSDIGLSILNLGGNAIEAAIAATFCLGVISPASSGIGGGCYMLIRNATSGSVEFIDAREVAPNSATSDMFASNPLAAQDGALGVAVLGEVKGLELAFQRHRSGNVTWKQLVAPAASLAASWTLSPTVADLLHHIEPHLLSGNYPLLAQLYLNAEQTSLKKAGETVEQPQLSHTLWQIAEHGADYLYSTMASTLAEELQALGGIVTAEDIGHFSVSVRVPLSTSLAGHTFVSVGDSSSGGVVVAGILKFLDSLPVSLPSLAGNYVHYLVEAMKHAFAMRLSLGDPDYVNTTGVIQSFLSEAYMSGLAQQSYLADRALDRTAYGGEYNLTHSYALPEDKGTSHISVLDRHGHAVSMTTTINTYFGSKVVSPSTGLLWNNQMDDFSIPGAANYFGLAPSPYNYPAPRKKPLSSMSPCMLLDRHGRVRFIGGASGGPRIITATAQMLLNAVWFGMDLLSAVRRPRVHTQFLPDSVDVERQVLVGNGLSINASQDIVANLQARGHHNVSFVAGSYGVSQFISVDYDSVPGHTRVQAVADPRKNGRPAMAQR